MNQFIFVYSYEKLKRKTRRLNENKGHRSISEIVLLLNNWLIESTWKMYAKNKKYYFKKYKNKA